MEATIVIISLVGLLILLLTVGAPIKSLNILGHIVIRIVIGVLFLFFFNVFGGFIGLHLPINIFTVIISSILGVIGVITLAMIQIVFL